MIERLRGRVERLERLEAQTAPESRISRVLLVDPVTGEVGAELPVAPGPVVLLPKKNP